MHIHFAGIGGAGLGPLAMIARQAGYSVSGSDKQESDYLAKLRRLGINTIYVGDQVSGLEAIHGQQPIDWLVYSTALPKENPDHPFLRFAAEHEIKCTKRDELINYLLSKADTPMLAISGTHGKTTTTAMAVWLLKQMGWPIGYSVGAKLSFGEMGEWVPEAKYFVYECDEYDRNFLHFEPRLSLITGIDWDHPDIYPTRAEYQQAYRQFFEQSKRVIAWQSDVKQLAVDASRQLTVLSDDEPAVSGIKLIGEVNRRDAWLVVQGVSELTGQPVATLLPLIEQFPGVSRRFEQLRPGLVSDYAHTPRKIKGALQLAHEVAGQNVVVVYEGLHNTRQHFIKHDLKHLFDSAQKLLVVPTYLAREDQRLPLLSSADLIACTSKPQIAASYQLDDQLRRAIDQEISKGNLVLCFSAGGGGSLDEWLRREYK